MNGPSPGEGYYQSIQPGSSSILNLPEDFRYVRVVCTVTGVPAQDASYKLQLFNDPVVTKTFNNTIEKAKGWMGRWKR